VRPVSRKLAQQIIYKYEWLGTMAGTSAHYGIFFGTYCAGVACVAVNGVGTAGPYVHRQFGIFRSQLATLARGACVHWAPAGTNSRLVAWTCRLLAREASAKVLIAYSDTDAGEVGTIYQACGWTYIGRSEGTDRPDMQLVSPNGRVLNRRKLSGVARDHRTTIGGARSLLCAAGWREQASNPKHRYVCVLDKTDAALVARVERMRRPYPKRATGVDSDTPAIHAGEGGASPTVALSSPPDDGAEP
jgi:hypothetical protein